jgi:molecular chaperone DnaK
VTRTEQYSTAYDFQTAVEVDIYQGDDPDALRNVHVGHFRIDGLTPVTGSNPVLCRMRLDLDGILHVTAIEKKTGLSKHVAITGATRPRDTAELAHGREELERLFAGRLKEDIEVVGQSVPPVESADVDAFGSLVSPVPVGASPAPLAETKETATATAAPDEVTAMIARCRERIPSMHPDDQEEAIGLIEELENASQEQNPDAIAVATKALNEFLFFVEGR